MSEESTSEDFVTSTTTPVPQNLVTETTKTSTTENSIFGKTTPTLISVSTPAASPQLPQFEVLSNSPESFVDETLSETKEAFSPVLLPDNNNDEFELETVKIDEIEDNTPLTLIQQNLEHHRDFRNDDLKTPPVNCPESPENNNNILSTLEVPHDETATTKKSKRKRTKVRGDAFTVEFADEQPNNQPGSHFQGPNGPFASYSRDDKEKFEKVKIYLKNYL